MSHQLLGIILEGENNLDGMYIAERVVWAFYSKLKAKNRGMLIMKQNVVLK